MFVEVTKIFVLCKVQNIHTHTHTHARTHIRLAIIEKVCEN